MSNAGLARSLESYADVLRASTEALDRNGVDHVVFGSIATRALGRARPITPDEDIDLFVRPPDASAALDALERASFVAQEHDESWIHKAKRAGVTVDVIFKAAGRIYVDHEMIDRAITTAAFGVQVRLIPREDLAIMKALIHDEDRAFDWFDALSLIERSEVDWEYLLRRAAAFGAQRVLSLLLFAETAGVEVPRRVIDELQRRTVGDGTRAG
jgi:predicted nucleotidyltransferase